MTEQVKISNNENKPKGENKELINYILKEIDKLDEIKKNLCSAIVDIK